MRLDVITIFPEYLEPLRHALLGKAIEQEILSVGVHDLRRWATDVHKSVDDTPYGGGPGMVMKPEVWGPALDDVAVGAAGGEDLTSSLPHVDKPRHDELAGVGERDYGGGGDSDLPLLIVPTPAGKPFTQADAQAWSNEEHIVFACGRYEGIDQRVVDDAANRYRVREVSIGDYVLIGGEVAVLVIAEAIVRLIPGVLGNRRSHEEDSFSDGLLEGPSYTKPRSWRGLDVPEVLFSGNHGLVDRWRRDQALLRTQAVRPELLADVALSAADRKVLGLD
jgi:tRNA (guanine37-N1)-methyltransferase